MEQYSSSHTRPIIHNLSYETPSNHHYLRLVVHINIAGADYQQRNANPHGTVLQGMLQRLFSR